MRKKYKDQLVLLSRFSLTVVNNFSKDDCLTRSSALAYTSLFSLVPLIIVSYAVFSGFPEFNVMAGKIQNVLVQNLVPNVAREVVKYIDTFVSQAGKLNVMGFSSLLLVAVLTIFNIERAFNHIWGVEKRRDGMSAFLLYWGVLTLAPILASVVITIGNYILALPWIASTTSIFSAKTLFKLMEWGVTSLMFAFLYDTMPNCKIRFRHAMIGGISTMVLFDVAKGSLVHYIRTLTSYEVIYGALAVLPIFLFWLYVLWLVILVGAEVTRTLGDYERDGITALQHFPTFSFQIGGGPPS